MKPSNLAGSCLRPTIPGIIRAPQLAICAVSRSMTNYTSIFFWAFISIFAYWFWNRRGGRGGGDDVEIGRRTYPDVRYSVLQNNEKRIQELLEIRRAEQEADDLQRSKILNSMKRPQIEIEDQNGGYFLRSQNKLREDKKRIKEEHEQSIKRYKLDLEEDRRKHDEKSSRERNQFAEKNKIEMEELEKESERNRKIYRQQQQDYEYNSLKQANEIKELEETRKRKLEQGDREHEEKMRKIKDDARREQYESSRRWNERKIEADRQFAQILRILQLQRWNSAIETNWTNRLNFLRSANREVERLYSRLRDFLSHSLRSDFQNPDLLKQYSNSLVQSIQSEKTMMLDEESKLNQMYRTTNKSFLLVIQKAVRRVAQQCEDAISLTNGINYNTKITKNTISELDRSFDLLRKASLDIPTLAMLRRQYSEDMKYEENDSPNPQQTVIIEEVE